MSLVRYRTGESIPEDSSQLVVVCQSKGSDEVILYDALNKDFQIMNLKSNNVKLIDDYIKDNNQHRNTERFQNNNSRNFRYNNIDNDNNNINNVNNNRRLSSFPCPNCGFIIDNYNNETISDASIDSDIDIDNDNNGTFDKNELMNVVSTNLNSRNDQLTYIDNNSSFFFRPDYFRLLASTLKNDNEPLLTDGTDSFSGIPDKLINQGYFEKFFKIIEKIGSGSFGSVYKVEHELLGLNLGIFALKKIPIGNNIENLKKSLSEIKFLYNLSYNNNNNIVKYNHFWIEYDQISKFTPNIPVVFILFEYCDGGTLESWIDTLKNNDISLKMRLQNFKLRKDKNSLRDNKVDNNKERLLNDFEIFKIFSDITQGLDYLHSLKILHRDLKPSNVLLKEKFDKSYKPIDNVKDLNKIPKLLVSDFGESIMISSNNMSTNRFEEIKSTGNTGTLEFVAPEIISNRLNNIDEINGGFTYSSDIYSLGLVLYYICFQKLPFKHNDEFNPDEICSEILNLKLFEGIDQLRPISEFVDKDTMLIDWINLIKIMVSKNPTDRPSTSEILKRLEMVYQKLEIVSIDETTVVDIQDDEITKQKESDNIEDHKLINDDVSSEIGYFKMLQKKLDNSMFWPIFMILTSLHNIYFCKNSKILNLQFFITGLYFGNIDILNTGKWLIIIVQIFITVAIYFI